MVTNNSTSKTVQIFDTSKYSNQPSVNARAALVMDGNTGEVLYSKNSNTALPIASITKLMTAVVISDADMTTVNQQIKMVWEKIQQKDFYTGCGKEDCHWCNFVKNNELAVALHELEEEI